MSHYVYILKSESTNKYYCGESQDAEKRFREHNAGKSKYTKSGVPWVLRKLVECENRSEARKLELKIKRQGIKRWLGE